MSEDYEKFHEIPPLKVKADPSTRLNDEYYPWLRRNKQRTQAKKSEDFLSTTISLQLHVNIDDDVALNGAF